MANIKPAEVSNILRQQLEGIQTGVDLEEVGTVLEVGDGIARITDFQMLSRTSLLNLRTELKQSF
jgi:F-type H+-transporting ATPase subunit alpha